MSDKPAKPALPAWEELARGVGCPLCEPRVKIDDKHYFVIKLPVSSVYLSRNQTNLGYCTLVYDPHHVTRMEELTEEEYVAFNSDLYVLSRALSSTFSPDHMNYAVLGNNVPHLHWHVIPRYQTDPRWRQPVWRTRIEEIDVVWLKDEDCELIAKKIRNAVKPLL